MGRRFGVETTWRPTDKEYMDTKKLSLTEKRNNSTSYLSMGCSCQETRMNAKYAGAIGIYVGDVMYCQMGKKVAKKLCWM